MRNEEVVDETSWRISIVAPPPTGGGVWGGGPGTGNRKIN